MSKSTKAALMASLLLGATVLSACSKDASEPQEKVAPAAKKNVEKAEAKVEPKPAPVVETAVLTPEMAGKKVFKRCKSCHTINEGGKRLLGPNLYGMFGRKSGTVEGFNYSKAMIAADITWTDETVSAYLAKPKAYIPNNKMSFLGVKKEADRDNVIAYLKANTGS